MSAAPAGDAGATAGPGVAAAAPGKRQRQRRVKPGEEPIQAGIDPQILDSIFAFFGLEADFALRQQLVTRSGASADKTARKIYLVTSGAFHFLFLGIGGFPEGPNSSYCASLWSPVQLRATSVEPLGIRPCHGLLCLRPSVN